MNKAVLLATGNYVIFMNAGDVFYNDTVIENVNKNIEQYYNQLSGK